MAKSRLTPDYIEWVLKLNADQAAKEMHKINQANRELAKQQDAARQAMAKLEAEGKKGSQEWKNLKISVKEYGNEIKTNNEKLKELDKRLDLNQRSAAELSKRLRTLRKELQNTSKATDPQRYKELQHQIKQTEAAYRTATGATKGFASSLLSLAGLKRTITGFFMGMGSMLAMSVISGFKQAINTIIDFEKANSRLAGVLGTTKAGIKDLTDEARRLGATTSYTASEVTQLQTELAKLGFDKNQIKAMEEPILKFAVAVDTDLASAATVAGGALRVFGKDAADSESVLATLAVATTKSALSFENYSTMLSTAAPVAHAFNFSLEDTTALMGALRNANFDATSAATATRNILLNLANGSGKLAKALGGPVKDLDGLVAGLKKLKNEGIDLATALDLTDKRSVAAFETFLNGADSILTLRNSITGVNGAFNDMYKEMGDNTAQSMKILGSTVEGLFLKFYEGRGAFKGFIDMLTQFVQGISDTVGRADSPINLLFTGLTNIFKAVGWVVNILASCSRAIYAGVAAWVAMKVAVFAYHKVITAAALAQKVYTTAVTAGKAAIVALTTANKAATVSTKALDAATTATPWGAIAKAVTMLVVGIVAYATAADDAADGTDRLRTAAEELDDVEKQANSSISEQIVRVNKLKDIVHDNNIEYSERQKALLALKKIVPDYHAKLTKEGKLIDDNTDSLATYVKHLKAAALAQAYFDKMSQIQDEILDARMKENRKRHNVAMVQLQLDTNPEFESRTGSRTVGSSITGYTQTVDDVEVNTKRIKKLGELKAQQDALTAATNKRINAENRLRAVEAEMNKDPEVSALFNAKITKGDGGGGGGSTSGTKKDKTKNKHDKQQPGTYSDNEKVTEVEKPLKAKHEENMAVIEDNKEAVKEADYIIAKNKEIIRYAKELTEELDKLKKKVPESEQKTLDAIAQKQAEAHRNQATAQAAINAQNLKKTEEIQEQRLDVIETFYSELEQAQIKSMNNQEITEEQFSIWQLNQTRLKTNDLLQSHEEYYDKIKNMANISEQSRQDILKREGEKIAQLQMQQLKDMTAIHKKIEEMTADPVGLEAMELAAKKEEEATLRAYDTMIEIAKANGMDIVELERQKAAKVRKINYQLAEELYGIQEQIGVSWGQEYAHELAQLQKLKDDELITEREYQLKRLGLLLGNIKKYLDYYAGSATTMFSAIQQAEIDSSEAKYDALISQAEANGEDTAALEEEKENKKLEIQKKYADVNFAIKISQIIADTAVSIMKAYAELGPIGGVIAAAMITATGIAQVISAKAERDKIKNLQPKSGASKVQSAERVVSGYSDGGYTGDGKRLEVAGVVHRGEYVVPQPIMGDPRVVDAVNMIEAIRRQRVYQGEGGNSLPKGRGFANGGHTGGGGGELAAAASELRAATEAVKQLRAYVVYQDIEKAGEVLENARDPFTRN